MKQGIVSLVGAGPGDPDLLTLKGKKVLEKADTVIYDRLVHRAILAYAPAQAELIYAGKASGSHALSQNAINRLLVQKAREGKAVVRLKGGDPFIFGRGGEEAVYLIKHGCAFEVVPGISSAVAAPAYAGIPVTHRDLASSLAVITGHGKAAPGRRSIRWREIARGIDTLVVVMGVEHIASITGQIVSGGKPPDTPAALIRCGTLPEQEVITGTLKNIAARAKEKSLVPPAVLVVGRVVSLRSGLNWAEQRPLWGKRIVVTRPRHQAAAFSEKIRELGGEALELPVIEIVKEKKTRRLQAAVRRLHRFDWVIFTSVNAVEIFFEVLGAQQLDARSFQGVRVCAIGPATRQTLKSCGLVADLVPKQYSSEGIVRALRRHIRPGDRVLLPRARGAGTVLAQGLAARGARVEEIGLYRAVPSANVPPEAMRAVLNGHADMLSFTSSSAVNGFCDLVGAQHIDRITSRFAIACIGPVTAATAQQHGLTVDIAAEQYTIDGLVEAMVNYYARKPSTRKMKRVKGEKVKS